VFTRPMLRDLREVEVDGEFGVRASEDADGLLHRDPVAGVEDVSDEVEGGFDFVGLEKGEMNQLEEKNRKKIMEEERGDVQRLEW
jgi:hypothetical protein